MGNDDDRSPANFAYNGMDLLKFPIRVRTFACFLDSFEEFVARINLDLLVLRSVHPLLKVVPIISIQKSHSSIHYLLCDRQEFYLYLSVFLLVIFTNLYVSSSIVKHPIIDSLFSSSKISSII